MPQLLERRQLYVARLRKSVTDLDKGLIDQKIYVNEREIAQFCNKKKNDALSNATSDECLDEAVKCAESLDYRQVEEWVEFAQKLEKRATYTYRLF